jgi:hypothetical protein
LSTAARSDSAVIPSAPVATISEGEFKQDQPVSVLALTRYGHVNRRVHSCALS